MDVTVKTRKHSIQLLTITAETTDGGIVDDELAETTDGAVDDELAETTSPCVCPCSIISPCACCPCGTLAC